MTEKRRKQNRRASRAPARSSRRAGGGRRSSPSRRVGGPTAAERTAKNYLGPRLFNFLKSRYSKSEAGAMFRALRGHIKDLKKKARSARRAYTRERAQKEPAFRPAPILAVLTKKGKTERYMIFRGRENIRPGKTYTAGQVKAVLSREQYHRFVKRTGQALGITYKEARVLIGDAKKAAEKEVRAEKSRLRRVISNKKTPIGIRNKARKKLRALSLKRARRRAAGMLNAVISEVESPSPRRAGS